MIVAKSIAGGLPLSGVIGRAEIMDHPHLGAIGGTFIGNPGRAAAALAVLDVFAEEELVAKAEILGNEIRSRMLAWQSRWPQIGDVRGRGAMLAIELVRDPATKEPAPRPHGRGHRGGVAAGPPAPEGRGERELHPGAVPVDHVRGRARRRSSRLGRGADGRSRLAHAPPLRKTPRVRAGEERKLVTVLFADLVGSTAYAGDRDPERVRAQLEPFYGAMREEIELTGGTVEKFAGRRGDGGVRRSGRVRGPTPNARCTPPLRCTGGWAACSEGSSSSVWA
jgi:hypothetical protein